MTVHVPGLVWSAAFLLAAVAARLLPEQPPPRHVVDKYLHVPSTFPTQLANRGLHRPQARDDSGMTPGMQPYGPPGAMARRGSLKSMSHHLAGWGVVFLLMAFFS